MNTSTKSEVAERKAATPLEQIESILIRGDLSLLSTEQRVTYVKLICERAGLNSLTRPFIFMTQQGREVLYATKDCADQLRKINGISIEIIGNEVKGGLLIVTAKATDKTGRTDQDYGATSVGGLTGEAAANAVMKAITKAKRRVTLSIAGYGFAAGDDADDIGGDLVEGNVNEVPKPRAPIAPRLPQGKPASEDTRATTKVPDRTLGGDNDEAHRQPPASTGTDDTIDKVPGVIERKGDSATAWSLWGQAMLAAVREAPTVEAINAWTAANHDSLQALQLHDNGKFTKLVKLIEAELEKKAPKDE